MTFKIKTPYNRQKLRTNSWIVAVPPLEEIRFVMGQGILKMTDVKSIITHPGLAHRDDVLATAIALSIEGDVPVTRRVPTEEELNSPSVLVLDVGERYEPELNNFDHHQLNLEDREPECALSLYLKARKLEDIFDFQRWYLPTVMLDALGPYQTARIINLSRFPFELVDPIGQAIINLFGSVFGNVPQETLSILKILGDQILSATKKFADQLYHLERVCDVVVVNGYKVLILKTTDTTASQEFRNRFHPDAIAAVSWDNRGSGWSMYRFSAHCPLDFHGIQGHPDILFAHRDGSLAKTGRRLPLEDVLDLISRCILTSNSATA